MFIYFLFSSGLNIVQLDPNLFLCLLECLSLNNDIELKTWLDHFLDFIAEELNSLSNVEDNREYIV